MNHSLIVALIVATASLTGCKDDATSDPKDTESAPAGAPAEVKESKVQNAALVECGYPDQDCATVNLNLLKEKGKIRGKSEAPASSDAKGLDCSGGKAKPNGDGTMNLCDCTCVAESQIAKK